MAHVAVPLQVRVAQVSLTQLTGVPMQVPPLQVSPAVHGSPSSQPAPSAEVEQYPAPLQDPVEQGPAVHSFFESEPAGSGPQLEIATHSMQSGQSAFCVKSAAQTPEPSHAAQTPQSVPLGCVLVGVQSAVFGSLQFPTPSHRPAEMSS
jgi:hypothetical protein